MSVDEGIWVTCGNCNKVGVRASIASHLRSTKSCRGANIIAASQSQIDRIPDDKLRGLRQLDDQDYVQIPVSPPPKPAPLPAVPVVSPPRVQAAARPAPAPSPPPVEVKQAPREYVIITRASELSVLATKDRICVLDCEGVKLSATGELCLLQVAFPGKPTVLLFDICALAEECKGAVRQLPLALVNFLQDQSFVKLVHDVRNDAASLFHQFKVELRGVLDTQLWFEYFTPGSPFASLNDVLEKLHPKKASHQSKAWGKKTFSANPEIWKKRPLEAKLLEYAVQDVKLLAECNMALPSDVFAKLFAASEKRCHAARLHGEREMCFLKPSWQLGSQELAEAFPETEKPQKLVVNTDNDQLLRLLPPRFRANGELGDGSPLFKLRDIVLDLGRRPIAYFHSERKFLSNDEKDVVREEDIKQVEDGLGGLGFGPDNRAGINGCLHRISAIKNKLNHVIGLTLRVGRSVPGNAGMIADLVLGPGPVPEGGPASLLILGVPGTGKTTIVREVARLLAERDNVCVVDTSNEICGDGDIPHPCVGAARRMMVPCIEHQSKVMVECLQNHTPDVILIDEVGRRAEVEAARTVKQRGVRLVASAHGDLRSLVKNSQLNGLVGGVETVTLGDAAAKKENDGRKLQATRQAMPVFEVVVELSKENLNCWRVVKDVAVAVDDILAGEKYKVQTRTRLPEGGMQVALGYN